MAAAAAALAAARREAAATLSGELLPVAWVPLCRGLVALIAGPVPVVAEVAAAVAEKVRAYGVGTVGSLYGGAYGTDTARHRLSMVSVVALGNLDVCSWL